MISALAVSVAAYHNLKKRDVTPEWPEWMDRWEWRIEWLCKNYMPSGSGFNNGTTLDLDRSTSRKLVFYTSFQQMNEHGFYIGWLNNTVTAYADLAHGFVLKVTREGDASFKDFVADTFNAALRAEHPPEKLYPPNWPNLPSP